MELLARTDAAAPADRIEWIEARFGARLDRDSRSDEEQGQPQTSAESHRVLLPAAGKLRCFDARALQPTCLGDTL